MKWAIGEVEIFQIIEVEAGKIIQDIIKEATPENLRKMNWLYPDFVDDKDNIKALVQSFLIKSENKYILVDTCNGNDKKRVDFPVWSDMKTDFIKKLNNLGVNELNIKIVICTHFHCDHIGWNTKLENGVWKPTFPNAKYYFVKKEYEYWSKNPEKEYTDDKIGFEDSIIPIVNSGLANFIEDDLQIDENIKLIPTPGHTPHHVSIQIESKNEKAIISGDVLWHPCQIAYPEWSIEANTIPDQARQSRIKLINDLADTNTLLIGSHFANPVAGRIIKKDNMFIFQT